MLRIPKLAVTNRTSFSFMQLPIHNSKSHSTRNYGMSVVLKYTIYVCLFRTRRRRSAPFTINCQPRWLCGAIRLTESTCITHSTITNTPMLSLNILHRPGSSLCRWQFSHQIDDFGIRNVDLFNTLHCLSDGEILPILAVISHRRRLHFLCPPNLVRLGRVTLCQRHGQMRLSVRIGVQFHGLLVALWYLVLSAGVNQG